MKILTLFIFSIWISFSSSQNVGCDYQKLTNALTAANNIITSINGSVDYDISTFHTSTKTLLTPINNCKDQIISWTNFQTKDQTKLTSECIHSDTNSTSYKTDPCCNQE